MMDWYFCGILYSHRMEVDSVVLMVPLLAVIPDKAERELNAEGRRAAESQSDTAIMRSYSS
jgi:hypothetical protein